MRLSLVFELLLIFVLLAFAASRVIDSKGLRNSHHRAAIRKPGKVAHKNRQDVNKYCSCSTKLCNCCRQFNIPLVAFQGPGCATLQYLQGDRLAISMSFGERVLTNTTISGRRPRPVCMPLPGGVSKFCGRVYNIGRQEEDFKACLGLELRALQDIEASLRVSCFRFGPRGLKVEPAQPLPVIGNEGSTDEDDDDDDYDDDDDEYGFDDDDYGLDNDIESADYNAFSVFDDEFVGDYFEDDSDSDDDIVPIVSQKPVRRVTAAPVRKNTRKPSPFPSKLSKPVKINTNRKPVAVKTTSRPKTVTTSTTTARTVMVPVATIASIKKPEMPDVNINSVSGSQSDVQSSTESVSLSPHESIAVVSAMLQNSPGEMPQVAPIDVKPAKFVPNPALSSASVPSSVTKPVVSEVMTDANVVVATEQPIVSTPLETSMQENTQTEYSQKYESTTVADRITNTVLFTSVVGDDEEELNTEPSQSLILRDGDNSDDEDSDDAEEEEEEEGGDDDDDDEDNDDDDDDDDNGDEDVDGLGDQISLAVDDVLGDDDDSNKNKTKKGISKKVTKDNNNNNNKNKKETTTMLDDIVDGVVETITGEEVSDTKSEKPHSKNTLHKNNDDAVDDDEVDDDDEDGDGVDDVIDLGDDNENEEADDDISDDDDNEDGARKTRIKRKSTSRQSKDMWLDRLHWQ